MTPIHSLSPLYETTVMYGLYMTKSKTWLVLC